MYILVKWFENDNYFLVSTIKITPLNLIWHLKNAESNHGKYKRARRSKLITTLFWEKKKSLERKRHAEENVNLRIIERIEVLNVIEIKPGKSYLISYWRWFDNSMHVHDIIWNIYYLLLVVVLRNNYLCAKRRTTYKSAKEWSTYDDNQLKTRENESDFRWGCSLFRCLQTIKETC